MLDSTRQNTTWLLLLLLTCAQATGRAHTHTLSRGVFHVDHNRSVHRLAGIHVLALLAALDQRQAHTPLDCSGG
jgi:hypothetical protein